MKIKKDYDVTSGAPDWSKGTSPEANPGIHPSTKPIADTPGERMVNPAAKHETSKGQPFGKGGAGYTN